MDIARKRDTPDGARGVELVANQVGKRYQCEQCNTQMIVTKGGTGELQCCNATMKQI